MCGTLFTNLKIYNFFYYEFYIFKMLLLTSAKHLYPSLTMIANDEQV